MQDLTQWVRQFPGRRVLVVGDLILDRYVYGDAERISPEAPVPVLRTVETTVAVGGSANVAACLRALGCGVFACGLVGKDANGNALQSLLAELGVDGSGILALDDRPTTTKTRLVGLAQHRHRQQLLRVDEEDVRPLSATDRERLIDKAVRCISNVDVICVEDYEKGVVADSLVRKVLKEARRLGKPVLVDPARLPSYERYRGVDFVTPNREELAIVSGTRFSSLEETAMAAAKMTHSFEIGTAVVTLDRDGALLVETRKPWRHFPTIPRSVYDNTGAGDAVLAMLAASIAAGADKESAVRLANVAGGLEVEKFGCVPITAEEILAELRLESRLRNGKLRTSNELAAELTLRRDRGETVGFTNGCFDILHAGHVDFLRRCRQEASILVVGLNSDASVRAQKKGSNRPINRFEDRASVLSALECVDYVVGFEEVDPEALIRKIRPDVLVKGKDWEGKCVKGREFVESVGGRVVLLPLVDGLSTTALIQRVLAGA